MIKRILKNLGLILILAVFGLVYCRVSWFFAHSILDGDLVGNDSRFALGLVRWFARWWPERPLWFPGQGAGVSLYHSYPMLPTFLVIIASRFLNTDLEVFFRVCQFAIFPFTALGISLLTLKLTKSFGAGFIAGILFLISEASWAFLRLHGLFAQTLSLILLPWVWFFGIDLWERREKKKGGQSAWSGLGLVFSLSLTFLAHPVAGAIAVGGLVGYFCLAFFEKKRGIRKRLLRCRKMLVWLGLGVGLASFWLIPFFSYSRLANRNGMNTMGLDQLKEVAVLPKTLLGFNEFLTGSYRYDAFFFAWPVLLMFFAGWVSSYWLNRRLWKLGWLILLSALFVSLPVWASWLLRLGLARYVFTAIYFRALLIPIVLLPVVAAGGVWAVWDWLIGLGGRRLFKKKIWSFLGGVFKNITYLYLALTLIFFSVRQPPSNHFRRWESYGIKEMAAYGPSLDQDWKELLVQPQLIFRKVPWLIKSGSDSYISRLDDSLDLVGLSERSRLDISPVVLGGNALQDSFTETEGSIINLYHFFASIIHRMWGYQAGVFFGLDPLYEDSKLLSELTKWYGPEFVYLKPDYDRVDNYANVGYEKIFEREEGVGNYQVWQYPDPGERAVVTNRPVVLVVGDSRLGGYDQVFRVANLGGLSYDEAWLVEGERSLANYSLKELAAFDGLILHGYQVGMDGWEKVVAYLNQGGLVWVETGWQYENPDWGQGEKGQGSHFLPAFFPVEKTTWQQIGPGWEQAQLDLGAEIDLGLFTPLLWAGDNWGAAVARYEDLRPKAEPVLTYKDQVLMAMIEVGEGRLIWSGWNLFSHATSGQMNAEEAKLMRAIFLQHGRFGRSHNNYSSDWTRSEPDKVAINWSESGDSEVWVLWKESFSPNWQIEGARKIYRAGPGFVLVRIDPSHRGDLVFEYRLRWWEDWGAKLISLLSLGGTIFIFVSRKVYFGQKQDKK